jgi:hypothetical protein
MYSDEEKGAYPSRILRRTETVSREIVSKNMQKMPKGLSQVKRLTGRHLGGAPLALVHSRTEPHFLCSIPRISQVLIAELPAWCGWVPPHGV